MKNTELRLRSIFVGVALACVVPVVTVQALEDDPLHTVFARYHTYERDLGAFQTVNEMVNRLGVSCFYLDPTTTGVVDDRYTLIMDRANVTPAEVLDAIVAADPRLIWVPVDDRLVNVLPVGLVEDPNSVLFHPISLFAVEDVTLREAIRAVTACVPKRLRYGGGIGASMGGLPDGGTIYDRKVTVRLDSGTYLDLVNALMKAAGGDVGILATGPASFIPVKTYQGRTKTATLAHAESYLQTEGLVDRDEAIARFNVALEDAPYTALKKSIRFNLAELYMGSGGRLAYKLGEATPNQEKAFTIFADLAVPEEASDWDANVHSQCRDYVVKLLLDQGKVAEARQLLERVVNNPFSARLVAPEDIYARLIEMEIRGLEHENAVARLVAMRDEQPGNEHFHRALESRLERENASIR